jgi:FkbM family methyltransferase
MIKIAFVDTLGLTYDGSTLSKRGLGGSESAVISMARELAKLNFDVYVFNDCTSDDSQPGIYDNVKYFPINKIEKFDSFDIYVASRSVVSFMPDNMKHQFKWADKLPNLERVAMNSTYRVLWMHDTFCDGDIHIEELITTGRIHKIFTLSDWHTAYVTNCNHGKRRHFETLKNHIFQTRNGINLYLNEVDVRKKDPNLFVYNASVTKGMIPLVEKIWPEFKKQNPSAKLTVVGGYYRFRSDQGPDEQELKHRELVEKCKDLDITFTGIIRQDEIAKILAYASFMMYPSAFPETFGISTLESLAYNTPLITCRNGALEETAIDIASYKLTHAIEPNVLFTEINTDEQCKKFIELANYAYNTMYLHQQKMYACNQVKDVCTWDTVALQWKQHFYKSLGEFLPIEEYRKVTDINNRVQKVFGRRYNENQSIRKQTEERINVIVPVYNAEKYIDKCIQSVASQDYDNYHMYIINDASTDNTLNVIKNTINSLNENIKQRFSILNRTQNMGAVCNQISTIKSRCYSDEIVMLLDGDDWLVNDPNIFDMYNNLYQDGAEYTYGSCWSLVDNIPLIAQPYPTEVKKNKSYRNYKFNWNFPYPHLRTFLARLVLNLDESLFKDENGNWYRAGGDNSTFYNIIEQADPDKVICVSDVVYNYNDTNPINDYKVNGEEQNKTAKSIVNKKELSMKKILIAIPTAKYIESETFKSIYDLDVPDGYKTEFQFFYGYNIDQVRNLIASWAKHYDYLFSVDSDIILPKNTLTKMLAADKDIISGLYIQRHPNKQVVELYQDVNGGIDNIPYSLLEEPRVVEVAGCGFGCVLIKNKVFTTMEYPHFLYKSALTMEGTVSEDVYFCSKARSLGFTVWADTSIICDHVGSYKFSPYSHAERNIDEIYEQDALPKEHVMYLESLDIKPKVVYDIGACVKHWARHAERIWDSKVFLFDANMNLRKLYNRVGNEYFLGVLSDENKVVKFYEDEFNLGGNSYYKENTVHYNESHAKLVDATTLNDVVYERDWPLPDMIKLDVQGAEVDILKGASKILKNCTDIILEAQVIDYNSGAPKENEVIEFMKSIGYKLKIKITNNKTDNDYHFIKM